MNRAARILLCSALASCASPPPDAPPSSIAALGQKQIVPTVKHVSNAAGIDCQPIDTTPIQWNGGPVVHGTLNVYLLFYGLQWTQNEQQIMGSLIQSLGGSPYYSINTGYYDSSGNVANSVHLAGAVYLNNLYSGNTISDGDVWGFIENQFIFNEFPTDPNGLYLVLGDSQTIESSGLCTSYCGWHNHGSYNGVDIKYGFVGNPAACSNQLCYCVNKTSSPNNDPGIDGMASIAVHEVEETHTDPDLNAWYASDGAENADHCQWTYGSYQTASNGSYYNVTLGSSQYLIQQNWLPTGGCALSCTGANHTLCNGVCTDLTTRANCGACGNDCTQYGAAFQCLNGTCSCGPGMQVCCGGDVCAKTCPRTCP